MRVAMFWYSGNSRYSPNEKGGREPAHLEGSVMNSGRTLNRSQLGEWPSRPRPSEREERERAEEGETEQERVRTRERTRARERARARQRARVRQRASERKRTSKRTIA